MKPVEIEFLIKNGTKATLDKISSDVTKVGTNAVDANNAIMNSISNVGKTLAAGYGIQQLASQLYTFSSNYDKALREVSTISQVVTDDIEGYRQTILNMTGEIPVAADEATKALYQIISAGHDGEEGLNVLEVSAKAAIGGVTDTALAADTITTLLNAYKLSADDAENVSDMLFTTVKLGKTTMGELGQNIAQVAPIAASFGIEMDQVLGAVATLTKSGTPTAQAMTQIRAGVIAATKVLGDGYFATHTLQQGLADIMEMSGGSETKLRELVPEVEGLNAVLGLTGINAETAANDLGLMTDAAGATQVAYEKMLEGPDQQLVLLKNNALAYFSALGDGMLDSVGNIAAFLNEAFQSGDVEKFGEVVMVLVSAFGIYKGSVIATNVVMKVQKALLTEAIIQKRLAAAAGVTLSNAEAMAAARTTLLSAAQFRLVAALKAVKVAMMSNPWTAALIGITAVVSAIVLLRDRTSEAADAMKDATKEADAEQAKLKALENVLKDSTKPYEDRKRALDELQTVMPSYNASLSEEGVFIEDNTASLQRYIEQIKNSARARVATDQMLQAEQKRSDWYDAIGDAGTKALIKGDQREQYVSMFGEEQASKLMPYDADINLYDKLKNRRTELDAEVEKWSTAVDRYTAKSIELANNGQVSGSTGDTDTSQVSANYSEAYKDAETEWNAAKKSYNSIKEDKLATVEEFEAAGKRLETAEKAFQALGGTTKETKGGDTDQSDIERRNKELLALRIQNQQAEIDLMAEGSEKKIAQIELNYTKEIAEITAQEKRWRDAQDGELTDVQTRQITKATKLAEDKKTSDTSNVTDAAQKAEQKQYQQRLAEFKTFSDRYAALEKEHTERLQFISSKGGTKADIDAENKSYEDDLASLNGEVLATIGEFESLGIKATDKVIDEMIAKLQETKGKLESDTSGADNSTAIEAVNSEIERCIALKEKNNSTSQSRSLKEWQDMESQLNDCVTSFVEMGDAIGGTTGEIISASAEIATSTISMISGIVMLVENGISGMTAAGKAGSATLKAVETASVILAVIGAVISLTVKLYNLIEGNKQAAIQKEIDMYNELVSTYDTLIDKQKELLNNSKQATALDAYNNALDMVESKQEAAATSLQKWFSSGAGWFSHSEGYKYNEDFGDKLSQSQLFSMDAAQWEDWMTNNAKTWASLPDEVRNYAQAIMDSGVQTEELQAAWKEFMTGFSLDDARSSLLDMLNDFDATAEDVADNFTDHFTQAINKVVANGLDDDLVKWYDDLAVAMAGGLTKEEREALEAEYKRIVKEGQEQRDAAYEVTGYDPKDSATTQSGKSGSFEALSQDQGTKLEGLFTSAEIHLDSIDDNLVEMKDDIEEVSIQMSNATGYLKTIAENTTESKTTLAGLFLVIKKMISDGLKVK